MSDVILSAVSTTPYYSDDSVTIFHGSCEDILPTLTGIELVLTSPPYNLRGDGNRPTGTEFKNLEEGYVEYDDAMPHEEYVEWQHKILKMCWGTLTDDGAIFYNHKPRIGGNEAKFPFELIPKEIPIRQVIIWDRGSGFTRTFAHFVPAHEYIMLLTKPAFRTTTRSVDDVWRIPFETNNEHPAPFPLSLARTAVSSTSAQLILDPFMGSGTTLRAAKDCGRKAVGIEISERYCEMAAKRMSQEVLGF